MDTWDFVKQFYPNYRQCQTIARYDILTCIILEEEEDGSEAARILREEFGGYREHAELHEEYDKLTIQIYKTAIEGFFEASNSENKL